MFSYSDREGKKTKRDDEPHSLVNSGRRWYVVCWDLGRDDWRSFRVDRITRPTAVGVRFTPRELPVKDAAEFVRQSISSMPARYEAVLVLNAPAEELRKRWSSGWGKLKAIDDKTCEWRTRDDDLDWLAVRTLMLGVDFEVREPPELAEHLRALAARANRAAGSRSGR
jgi:predicted DNA-binding transcriptional regulator YafY